MRNRYVKRILLSLFPKKKEKNKFFFFNASSSLVVTPLIPDMKNSFYWLYSQYRRYGLVGGAGGFVVVDVAFCRPDQGYSNLGRQNALTFFRTLTCCE